MRSKKFRSGISQRPARHRQSREPRAPGPRIFDDHWYSTVQSFLKNWARDLKWKGPLRWLTRTRQSEFDIWN